MAEYIDRAELSVTPIDITDLPTDKCLMVYLAEDVDSLPTADVIERSKIDKAIEEMGKEIKENHLNVIEYADAEWILKDFVYGAIDRLKRNIGEQIL